MNLHQLRCIDGFFPLLLAQLEIDFADGRRITIVTDEKWKTTLQGPILWSDLLDGEGYDCRSEMSGWNERNFDDRDWKTAYSEPRDEVPLVWPRCQPVRKVKTISPVSMREVKPNVFVYDFGQELSGYCRLKIKATAACTAVKLRHAEKIGPDGMIDVEKPLGRGSGRRLRSGWKTGSRAGAALYLSRLPLCRGDRACGGAGERHAGRGVDP